MGGQVRLVHVATLSAFSCVRGFFSPRARGAGFLLPGVPAPFVYPLAHPRGALTLLLSPLLLPFVLLFAECRVVMRRPERYPRVFLIVYALAMRSVA